MLVLCREDIAIVHFLRVINFSTGNMLLQITPVYITLELDNQSDNKLISHLRIFKNNRLSKVIR